MEMYSTKKEQVPDFSYLTMLVGATHKKAIIIRNKQQQNKISK